MTINVLVKIMFFVALIVPSIVYFTKRRESDFSRRIRIAAFADMAFVIMLLVNMLINGLVIDRWKFPALLPNSGVICELLYITLGLLRLFSVWKMKAGTNFGSLFKKPNVSLLLFVVYLLVTAFILVKTAVGLLNYIIFGGIAVFLFWLLFVKMDILSMGFGKSASSGSSGNSSASVAHQCCASCSRYNNGKCSENPSAMIDEPLSHSCSQYLRSNN